MQLEKTSASFLHQPPFPCAAISSEFHSAHEQNRRPQFRVGSWAVQSANTRRASNVSKGQCPRRMTPRSDLERSAALTEAIAVYHAGQSTSFRTYSFSCLKSPVFQSPRSASAMTWAVRSVQHSSVLSVKRTRMNIIPSSKTCSAQSTILP
jgi:hypothetical protein